MESKGRNEEGKWRSANNDGEFQGSQRGITLGTVDHAPPLPHAVYLRHVQHTRQSRCSGIGLLALSCGVVSNVDFIGEGTSKVCLIPLYSSLRWSTILPNLMRSGSVLVFGKQLGQSEPV